MLIAELISSFFFGDVSFIFFLHGRKFRKNVYSGIYSENGEQTIEKRFQTMLSTKTNRKEEKFIDLKWNDKNDRSHLPQAFNLFSLVAHSIIYSIIVNGQTKYFVGLNLDRLHIISKISSIRKNSANPYNSGKSFLS